MKIASSGMALLLSIRGSEPQQLALKQAANFVRAQTELVESANRFLDHLQRPCRGSRVTTVGLLLRDKCAGAVAQLDDAFMLELAIRFGNGIGVHHQVLGHSPYARQLLAQPQCTRRNGVLYLLHQLEVDRNTGVGIRLEQHSGITKTNCPTEIVQYYCTADGVLLSTGNCGSQLL